MVVYKNKYHSLITTKLNCMSITKGYLKITKIYENSKTQPSNQLVKEKNSREIRKYFEYFEL